MAPEAVKKKLMEETHMLEVSLGISLPEASTTPYLGCIGGKECTVMCTDSATVPPIM